MKVISIIKKRIEKQQERRHTFVKNWLYAYYCMLYEVWDYGKLAIPYFQKAENKIKELEKRGLLEVTYKQIKKGVRVV